MIWDFNMDQGYIIRFNWGRKLYLYIDGWTFDKEKAQLFTEDEWSSDHSQHAFELLESSNIPPPDAPENWGIVDWHWPGGSK